MGALNVAGFDISSASYPALLTASITAKAVAPLAAVASVTTGIGGNTTITGLTLAGPMVSANVFGTTKLTSLATSGVINAITVDGASILAAVNFAHTHIIGGNGSQLIVKNNPKLTGLKSSTDYPAVITVTNNILLTSLDLSSYTIKLFPAALANTNITINGNKLSGDYHNAKAITPTTPAEATTITSSDLTKLKAFVASYPAPAPGVWPTMTLAINLDAVTLDGAALSATTLSAKMLLDAAHVPAFVLPATGITTQAEFALVQ
jgi:hypothetical protein